MKRFRSERDEDFLAEVAEWAAGKKGNLKEAERQYLRLRANEILDMPNDQSGPCRFSAGLAGFNTRLPATWEKVRDIVARNQKRTTASIGTGSTNGAPF